MGSNNTGCVVDMAFKKIYDSKNLFLLASLVFMISSRFLSVDLGSDLVSRSTIQSKANTSNFSEFARTQRIMGIGSICNSLMDLAAADSIGKNIVFKMELTIKRDEKKYEFFRSSTNGKSVSQMWLELNEDREVSLVFGDNHAPAHFQSFTVAFPNLNIHPEINSISNTDKIEFVMHFVRLRGDFSNEVGVYTIIYSNVLPVSESENFVIVNDELISNLDCGPNGVLGIGQAGAVVHLEVSESPYHGKFNSVQMLFALKFLALILFFIWLLSVFRPIGD